MPLGNLASLKYFLPELAVTAGAALLGITGALLAVPVAAAMGVIVRHGVQRYRDSALYADPHLNPPKLSDVGPADPP